MIKNISIEKSTHSDFIKLQKMSYTQKGIAKTWDLVEVHDSVAILIYNKDKDSFVLVKQFRPAVYIQNKEGFTYELCAGIVDKEIPLKQIAQEEIDEECGYSVPIEKIELITSFYTAVGFAGAKQSLYYCEVDDNMKTHAGGGIHVEDIEVIYLSTSEINTFILDESKAKTTGVMYAMMWWKEKRQHEGIINEVR